MRLLRFISAILLLFLLSCDKKHESYRNYKTDGEVKPIAKELRIKGNRLIADSLSKPEVLSITTFPEEIPTHKNTLPVLKPRIIPIPEEILTIIPGENNVPIPETVEVEEWEVSALFQKPRLAPAWEVPDNAQIDIRSLPLEKGITSSGINDLLEDSRGNFWLATSFDGLIRYDGTYFVHFNESEGLTHNQIQALLEDRKGNIWIGSRQGIVSRFDGRSFTHFRFDNNLFGVVNDLIEDRKGNIWIGYNNGLIVFSPEKKTANKITNENGLFRFQHEQINYDLVRNLLVDRHGSIWIGTYGGITKFEAGIGNSWGKFSQFSIKDGYPIGVPRAIYEDKKGDIWFGGQRGICMYTDTSFHVFDSQIDLPITLPYSFIEDHKGNLWIGSSGQGLFKWDGKNLINYTKGEGLSNDKVKTSIQDSQGFLWIATQPSGLDRIDPEGLMYIDKTNGLTNNSVFALTEDKAGDLWLAIHSYKNYGYGFSKFNNETVQNYFREQGIKGGNITSIFSDSKGNVWFGDESEAGLGKLNKSKGIINYYTSATGLSHNSVWSIHEDSLGRMWFGTLNGITLYEPETGEFVQFTNKEGLNVSAIQAIEEDKYGNLWLGTFDFGLIKFKWDQEADSANIIVFTEESGLANNKVASLLVQDEQIWIGTDGGGLSIYDGEKIVTYDEQNGFLDMSIMSIIEDSLKRIWISTQMGLASFSPLLDSTEESYDELIPGYAYSSYDFKDGFKDVNFNMNASHLDESNRLWLGTGEGLIQLNLSNYKVSSPAPTGIVLSHLEINQEYLDFRFTADSMLRGTNSIGEKLSKGVDSIAPFYHYPLSPSFSFDLNHLHFHFSAIDWLAPHKISYSYKLDGLDKEWSTPTHIPSAEYRNLSHGEYKLLIRAKGEGSSWSKPYSYDFSINPPWWLSFWAYIIYGIAFFAALWGFINWRTRISRLKLAKAQKLNDRLQQVDQLKDEFLANTSHELKTPLHGMVGIAESLFEQLSDEEHKENLIMLVSSGKRLSSLVNDLLDFSKVKNHDLQLSPKVLGLRPLVDLVVKTCLPLIGNKKLGINNLIPDDLIAVFADEERLQQVLYNLIGNAIKFTESGQITIEIYEEAKVDKDFIQIAVRDTGIGIPKGKQKIIFEAFEQADGSVAREFGGSGLGLSITRQLIQLHGGEIRVESEEGKGSTFLFTLPKASNASIINSIPDVMDVKPFLFKGLNPINNIKPASPVLSKEQKGDIRILLVDDEPINHQVIKNYFKGNQVYLYSVMSGQEALDIINSEAVFDLVLLDIMMPRLNGYEVCKKIREKYLPSELPVIMLTAKSQIADLIQGLETGANDYIPKPFSKDEFLARIKTHVNLHKIHQATHKFVPTDFLKSIDRKNITEVRLGDQKAQRITVFFSDIRSYTSLSESMSPKENFQFVNAYAGRMGPIIRKNHGFVNQYLGDGIMALFQQKPEDALKAAIHMQVELNRYNLERKKKARALIQVGMGMHNGPLIMGVIGDEERNDSATISDTVNTAARMEGLTKHFGAKIIISETVYEAIPEKADYHIRYLGLVQVKGKIQPLGVYECLDGMPEPEFGLKLNSLDMFNQGMQLYFSKSFDQAMQAFKEVLSINPEDRSAQLYLSRCSSLKVVGVADDWTGIELMNQK